MHHYGSTLPIEVQKMPDSSHSASSPETIAILARHAGMNLSPAHLADLVDAYGYIERMLARLHRSRPASDEPAHVFAPSTFDNKEAAK
jgi:hypothetical protein